MNLAKARLWNLLSRSSKHVMNPLRQQCTHGGFSWRKFGSVRKGILLGGVRYCIEECLEGALAEAVMRAVPAAETRSWHRIPLGLSMLSRGEISREQLRTALDSQREHGQGRIGEWLQQFGFASEFQVTAALARQWSCPVSKVNSVVQRFAGGPQVPFTLLTEFAMIPLEYVPSTSTLFVAFSGGIEYCVLYAIEQMLGCRTEACMALPSFVETSLNQLGSQRGRSEIVFESAATRSEICRIVRSYCVRISAAELRLARCGRYVWIRLMGGSRSPLDLLLCQPSASTRTSKDTSAASQLKVRHTAADMPFGE